MGVETVTLKRPDVFPTGTEVSLYPQGAFPNEDPATGPTGKAIATKKHEAGGAEYTELDPGAYTAAAKIGNEWRRVRVLVGKLGKNLKPPAAFPGHRAN